MGFHGGVPYRPLAELLQQAAVRQHQAELEEEIANGLVFILQEKWNQPSKFGCLAGDNPEFLVSIDSRGAIDIALKQSGERISHLFQSMGESTVLFLALSGATRRVLDTDIPFVMSGLGAFDRHLVGPCREFIAGMANQIVVFEDYWQGECG